MPANQKIALHNCVRRIGNRLGRPFYCQFSAHRIKHRPQFWIALDYLLGNFLIYLYEIRQDSIRLFPNLRFYYSFRWLVDVEVLFAFYKKENPTD